MNVNTILLDICRGYSVFSFLGKDIFVKHPSIIDNLLISENYKSYVKEFVKKGKVTEKDHIKILIEQNLWSKDKEKSISTLSEDIDTMERKKRFIKEEIQIDGIYESILFLNKKRQNLISERNCLLTNTAESFAYKECINYQLLNFCFLDDKFNEKAFVKDDLDYLESYYELVNLFIETINSVSFDSLKYLCVSPYFRKIFSSSKSDNFFSKATMDLTYPQLELLNCANCFSRAASEHHDYPESYDNYPDKILMWAIFRKNGGISIAEKQEKEKLELSQPIVK